MQALRALHNSEKTSALRLAVTAVPHPPDAMHVLDVGCGPASDVHKYHAAGLRRVLGLDINAAVVEEARRRSQRYVQRGAQYTYFHVPDVIAHTHALPPHTFHLIITNFSAHFFQPAQLCSLVRHCLAPGGVWVVATIDGDAVPPAFHGRHLRVVKSECGTFMEYALTGTRFFDGDQLPSEPVLSTGLLVDVAARHGLQLSRMSRFGSDGLPPGYDGELAMITGFHQWLHFTTSANHPMVSDTSGTRRR